MTLFQGLLRWEFRSWSCTLSELEKTLVVRPLVHSVVFLRVTALPTSVLWGGSGQCGGVTLSPGGLGSLSSQGSAQNTPQPPPHKDVLDEAVWGCPFNRSCWKMRVSVVRADRQMCRRDKGCGFSDWKEIRYLLIFAKARSGLRSAAGRGFDVRHKPWCNGTQGLSAELSFSPSASLRLRAKDLGISEAGSGGVEGQPPRKQCEVVCTQNVNCWWGGWVARQRQETEQFFHLPSFSPCVFAPDLDAKSRIISPKRTTSSEKLNGEKRPIC